MSGSGSSQTKSGRTLNRERMPGASRRDRNPDRRCARQLLQLFGVPRSRIAFRAFRRHRDKVQPGEGPATSFPAQRRQLALSCRAI